MTDRRYSRRGTAPARPDVRTSQRPAARADARTGQRPAARSDARTGQRPAARPDVWAVQRPAARANARTVQRPAARSEVRTSQRPAARSVAPDRRYAILKWALLAALLVYAALIVRANAARDVDFAAIESRVAEAPGLDQLRLLDENAVQERLGTTPEGCEGWLMYGADEVMNVDELLVVKGPEAALDTLEAAALEHVEAQLDVFRSYGVEQKDLLERARLTRRGSYLFYAVGASADDWEDAFLSAIR